MVTGEIFCLQPKKAFGGILSVRINKCLKKIAGLKKYPHPDFFYLKSPNRIFFDFCIACLKSFLRGHLKWLAPL